MADNVYCEACEELRTNAAELVVNGWNDDYCTTMQNDNGLGYGNNDCEDLGTLNDCLIGSMDDEAQITDQCDWRDYMSKFVQNLWTFNSAVICAICGIWTQIWLIWEQIELLWEQVNRLWCIVNSHSNGFTLEIGEDTEGESYLVAGKGVSFYNAGSGQAGNRKTDVTMEYIGGALVFMGGSLQFNQSDFTDDRKCWNFDNGSVIRESVSRKGNSLWHNTTGETVTFNGAELLYEVRISLDQYPQIKEIFKGIGGPTGGGAYHVNYTTFYAGEYANGQHGRCDPDTGQRTQPDYDDGHLVPDGWIYVQARMVSIDYMRAAPSVYSPRGYMGIRFENDEIICE